MGEGLIVEDFILFDLEVENQEEVVGEIAKAMNEAGRLLDLKGYIKDVKAREEQASTAVGVGIATPHAKSVSVKIPSLGFARLKHPIQWDNNEKVNFVFLIAVPSPGQGDLHLEIISSLFRKLVYEEFVNILKNSNSKEEISKLIWNREAL